MMYAIYNRKTYKLNKLENGFEIYSESKDIIDSSFKEIKIEQGFFSKIIYTKAVKITDIEFAYELKYKVIYNNIEFEPWSIGKHILEEKNISLYTSDSKLASLYGFTKEEQFVFKKELKLNDIEALIEIKIPILKFNYMQIERTRIEQKDIKRYLEDIIL